MALQVGIIANKIHFVYKRTLPFFTRQERSKIVPTETGRDSIYAGKLDENILTC